MPLTITMSTLDVKQNLYQVALKYAEKKIYYLISVPYMETLFICAWICCVCDVCFRHLLTSAVVVDIY